MEFLERIRDGRLDGYEWFYFLALALILAFGTIQTTGTALNTDRPVVSVISCSMYPVYSIGDVLIVQGQEFEDIEIGDIIVYRVPPRIEFTLDGNSFTLERNSPMYNASVETVLGRIELVRAVQDNVAGADGDLRNEALIRVGGELESVEEGGSVDGLRITDISNTRVPIVHRVVSKSEDSLETKGDANTRQFDFEKNVRPFQIHGTAAFRVPRVGALKLLVMDLVGYSGDAPLLIDRDLTCPR